VDDASAKYSDKMAATISFEFERIHIKVTLKSRRVLD